MEARKALDFSSGDVVRVWNKIKEADGKTRLRKLLKVWFLLAKHGYRNRCYILQFVVLPQVLVLNEYFHFLALWSTRSKSFVAHVRRSKLYYVRDKALRDVRRKLKKDVRVIKKDGVTTVEAAEAETPEEVNSANNKTASIDAVLWRGRSLSDKSFRRRHSKVLGRPLMVCFGKQTSLRLFQSPLTQWRRSHSSWSQIKIRFRGFLLVPRRGLEPPCRCQRYHLKVVRTSSPPVFATCQARNWGI